MIFLYSWTLFTSVFVAMFMAVFMRVFDGVRGNGHHQAAMLHALEADEAIGKLGNLGRFAVDDQHFKAGVVVKVGMAGGDHQLMVLMLHLGEAWWS
jgi:hypothetical protein